jgi:hypothetical protein
MANEELILSRDQRGEITRAVKAIEYQVKAMKLPWPAAYVIGTNLAIIRSNLVTAPGASAN